ncbi:hypothetical protein M0R45_004851 [Rubus argutus]|uniref:Cyclic nucleotide-binding domain-containing protein n=1 Tax=Rubus argutus TaxID=59490 RepID=A0AAW1YL13_RUBAR
MWAKGLFYFFLYLLASHVLGAFWYYFSIQQETTYVPTNETTPFDFGIFLDSLKNGNTGSIHFAKKFFYSFWWGLRNLSNFGTNMETSTYVWENCFAILISVIGLVLFLYLIGKVQTFISMKTEKSEERMKKLSLKEIEPPKTRKSLKKILCMETLKKVPMLENIDEKVLTAICEVLKPVIYQDNSFAFRMGEPLDRMLFITDGLIWTYHTTSSSGSARNGSEYIAKGDFYGDELLSWAYKLISNNDHSFKNVPMSNTNVKCHAQVEGFVLMAKDLKDIIAKHKFYWDLNNASQRRETASSKLQRAIRHYLVQNKSKNDTASPSSAASISESQPRNLHSLPLLTATNAAHLCHAHYHTSGCPNQQHPPSPANSGAPAPELSPQLSQATLPP